jgi:hypothetical protein
MEDSILTSTKKALGLDEDYTAFDPDIIMHINSALSTLNQLGIGPGLGFMIEDETALWSTFLGSDPRLNNIKSYVYLYVRALFDPPQTGFGTSAMQEQIKELAWRINVQREDEHWTDPVTGLQQSGTVLDGGYP